jgi:hypothetical protein|tara:strand:- start:220 stop:480 length:261 start_codon:yes stop_codon:yes gene_type:complete
MTYPAPDKIQYDAWFDDRINPLDLMPIARDEPLDTSPSEIQPPGVDQEEEVTMHEKMYRIATDKYNPFSVQGSEQLGGGSETVHKS